MVVTLIPWYRVVVMVLVWSSSGAPGEEGSAAVPAAPTPDDAAAAPGGVAAELPVSSGAAWDSPGAPTLGDTRDSGPIPELEGLAELIELILPGVDDSEACEDDTAELTTTAGGLPLAVEFQPTGVWKLLETGETIEDTTFSELVTGKLLADELSTELSDANPKLLDNGAISTLLITELLSGISVTFVIATTVSTTRVDRMVLVYSDAISITDSSVDASRYVSL